MAGVALAVNDFSSAVMTASTGDDKGTKELKGFVLRTLVCPCVVTINILSKS